MAVPQKQSLIIFSDNLHKSYSDNPPVLRYCFPPSDASSLAGSPPPCCLTEHRRRLQKLHPNTAAASDSMPVLFEVGPSWNSLLLLSILSSFNQSLLLFHLSTEHVREWEVAPPRRGSNQLVGLREMLHRHGDGLPAVPPAPTDLWICMDECQDCTNTSVL